MLASGYCLRAHFSLFLYVGGPQRQERERKRTHYVEIILLHELNLEVKLHFFYHILGIEAIANTCQIKKKKKKRVKWKPSLTEISKILEGLIGPDILLQLLKGKI